MLLLKIKEPPYPPNKYLIDPPELVRGKVKHVAVADDYGPMLGYHPNPSKSCLVVKNEKLPFSQKKIFEDTGIRLATTGKVTLAVLLGKLTVRFYWEN